MAAAENAHHDTVGLFTGDDKCAVIVSLRLASDV